MCHYRNIYHRRDAEIAERILFFLSAERAARKNLTSLREWFRKYFGYMMIRVEARQPYYDNGGMNSLAIQYDSSLAPPGFILPQK
jgi:hypothetical protein